jgi:hypothetical protein
MTGPRDWDKEMAEIDKLLAKDGGGKSAPVPQGSLPVPHAAQPQVRPATAVAQPAVTRVTRGRDLAGVWFRTLIGAVGAVALPFWPYGKTCGLMFYLYLVGAAGVIAAGIWAMRGAWTHRRGVALIGGLLVLIAGLGFVAIEILHRTSFAAARLGWIC